MDKVDMLDNAIKDAFEKLKKMQAGSEEYLQQSKAIATLYDLDVKIAESTCEEYHQEDQLDIEKERLKMEKERVKEENSWLKKLPWGLISTVVAGGFSIGAILITEKMQADGELIKINPFQIKLKP